MKIKKWTTAPISPTCEVLTGTGHAMCDSVTEYAYPAMGGGWMALCGAHGIKHLPHASHVSDLILKGEKFQ